MKGAAPAVKDFFSDLQLTPQTGLKLENRRKIREMIKSYRHAEYVSLYHYNEQYGRVYVLTFRHREYHYYPGAHQNRGAPGTDAPSDVVQQ